MVSWEELAHRRALMEAKGAKAWQPVKRERVVSAGAAGLCGDDHLGRQGRGARRVAVEALKPHGPARSRTQAHAAPRCSPSWWRTAWWRRRMRTRSTFPARSLSPSKLHPLVIVAEPEMEKSQAALHKTLNLDALTLWLADKVGLPYQHIDPLKVDVSAVAKVMSHAYASRFMILPVAANAREVVIATAEPFVREWEKELAHSCGARSGAWSPAPDQIQRYLPEFYNLARSMKSALQTHEGAGPGRRRQFRAAGGAVACRQARRQRPARGAHRGLAVPVRFRAARLGYPPRTAARSGQRAFPHRRRDAPGVPDSDPGDDRHHQPHQGSGAHGHRREAPPAGRPHQDPHPRRGGNRIAPVHHAHRLRRKAGDAHLQPRRDRAGLQGSRLRRAGRAALEPDGEPAQRHRPGHRSDRLGQDHHAVFHPAHPGAAGSQRLHGGRPDRNGHAAVQPDAGAAQYRPGFRQRHPHPDAPGPGHHHGGRDPRPGNGGNGDPGGA